MTTRSVDVLHTIHDWYDGPRAGAADYNGAAYWYRSLHLDTDEWNPDENRFELTPLSQAALDWELERTAIFKRWDAARRGGSIKWQAGDEESFGALPEDMSRYLELNRLMDTYLKSTAPTHLVRGSFPEQQRVEWSLVCGLP